MYNLGDLLEIYHLASMAGLDDLKVKTQILVANFKEDHDVSEFKRMWSENNKFGACEAVKLKLGCTLIEAKRLLAEKFGKE